MDATSPINYESFDLIDPSFFPALYAFDSIKPEFYKKLKACYPKLGDFAAHSCGQDHRLNIIVKEGNANYDKLVVQKSPWADLFDAFRSREFAKFCFKHFDAITLQENGFIGDLCDFEVEMQICESTTNYENPWHVDTRRRIIHCLVYFGEEHIKSGGELALGKHVKLKDPSKYPQYPDPDDITEEIRIPPVDNAGAIVLSTPRSYHRGCKTIGTRRFVYLAFNNKRGPAWKHDEHWNQQLPFSVALKKQHGKEKADDSL